MKSNILVAWALLVLWLIAAPAGSKSSAPEIPKTWDEAALAEWATPVAGLNRRPTHISAEDYYAMPVENLRTYPVYFPGREPEGYWEMIQKVGPQPLIEPEKLKNEADWIAAGRRVFEEADHLHLRALDAKIVAAARSPETFKNAEALADGTVPSFRWVPTKNGVALSFSNCSNCHLLPLPSGARIPGAPEFGTGAGSQDRARGPARTLRNQIYLANGVIDIGDAPLLTGSMSLGMRRYLAFGVPWRKDDINERLKTITEDEDRALRAAFFRSGGIPRWNGSLYFPTKIPDLIGIEERKYLDHTATHLHRGIGDLMRYAALVSFASVSYDYAHSSHSPRRVSYDDLYRVRAVDEAAIHGGAESWRPERPGGVSGAAQSACGLSDHIRRRSESVRRAEDAVIRRTASHGNPHPRRLLEGDLRHASRPGAHGGRAES